MSTRETEFYKSLKLSLLYFGVKTTSCAIECALRTVYSYRSLSTFMHRVTRAKPPLARGPFYQAF